MLSSDELLETLTPVVDNRFYIPQLIEQIEGDLSVIPFVGAGMSVPFRLPEWGELLESLAPDGETRGVIQGLLAASRYEEAADYLYDVRGANSFQNVFASTFGRQVLEGIEVSAAVRHLARFPSGPIVTSNFDAVLETVFQKEGAPFVEVVTASQQDRLGEVLELNLDALIKLHGDAGDRTDRILTFSDYERGYTSGPVRTVLENLASRPLLFLGCSLATDRPVAILKALAAEGRQLARHFAVVEKPDSEMATATRLKQLNDIRIRPIFYPTGRHDLIGPLLELLASRTPPSRRRRRGRDGPAYHNHPAPLGGMIGRDACMEGLLQDLTKFRIISLEGPRGIGKTTLLLHALHRLKSSDALDALVFTSASIVKSAFGVADIVDAISLTLDFPFSPQVDAAAREASTLAELERAGIRCLLAVDNYENIINREVDEFLTERLPANCTVLLTSANAVPFAVPGMKVVVLEELARDDALELFRRRADEHGVVAELSADVESAYSLTGGLPLAVEWVVGSVRAGNPLGTVLASIREGSPRILDELVHSCWSMLDETARALLFAISLFPTPPTQELLEAVCAISPEQCAAGIRQLRRVYLVKVVTFGSSVEAPDHQPRFVLHPITREFAEKQSTGTTGGIFNRRAAAYFLEFVKERGGTPELEEKQDSRALNRERLNILAVLERCRASQDDADLVALTYHLSRWLFIEGHWSNLETLAKYGIEAASRTGDHHSAGRLWAEWGRVLSHRSQFGKAEDAFAQALALASSDPPDVRTLGYLKHHMGEERIRRGQYDEARTLLEEARAHFEEIHSRRDMIGVGYRLAVLSLEAGELDEARTRLERGIEDTIDEQWARLEGLHRRVLGELELRSQPPQYQKARYQLARAATLITETDTRTHALIELSLAKVERGLGNGPRAAGLARAARDHFEKLRMQKEFEEADMLLVELTPEEVIVSR